MNSEPSCRSGTSVASSTTTAPASTRTLRPSTKRITGAYTQSRNRFSGLRRSATILPRMNQTMSSGTTVMASKAAPAIA